MVGREAMIALWAVGSAMHQDVLALPLSGRQGAWGGEAKS
jgi:hypothetical protein